MNGTLKGRWDMVELAGIFGLRHYFDTADEYCDDATYGAAYDTAIQEGHGEAEAEELATVAESEVRDNAYRSLISGFRAVLARIEVQFGIAFVESKRGMWRIIPQVSWRESLRSLRDTINGCGPFYFASISELRASGPYASDRQAFLHHVGWIARFPEVYGDTSFARTLELNR